MQMNSYTGNPFNINNIDIINFHNLFSMASFTDQCSFLHISTTVTYMYRHQTFYMLQNLYMYIALLSPQVSQFKTPLHRFRRVRHRLFREFSHSTVYIEQNQMCIHVPLIDSRQYILLHSIYSIDTVYKMLIRVGLYMCIQGCIPIRT